MVAHPYFVAVIFSGLTVFIATLLIGLRLKSFTFNAIDASNLRLSLEMSFFGFIFALLPFLLSLLFQFEDVVWSLTSLLMASYLLMQIIRVAWRARYAQAQWPTVLISLLVISGFLLTIETINILTHSPALYGLGLLWMLTLAGIQLIAFATYVSKPSSTLSMEVGKPKYVAMDHPRRVEWVRRHDAASHPDSTTHTRANRDPYRDSDTGEFPKRLAFTRPPRRSDPNTPFRPYRDPRAR